LNSKEDFDTESRKIICQITELGERVKELEIDVIIHLAYNIADTEEAYKENILNTEEIIKIAQEHKSHLVFASSAAVYGKLPVPHKEEMELAPINYYGNSKKDSEKIIQDLKSYTILRFFNIYGGKQPKGYFVPDMLEKIKTYEELIVENSLNVRDFVHINFVVKCIEYFAENKKTGIYNIGTGKPVKLIDAVRLIKNITHSKTTIISDEKKTYDSLADVSKLESLGLKSQTLEEGLKSVVSE